MIEALARVAGSENVTDSPAALVSYGIDATVGYRGSPSAVAFPGSAAEAAGIMVEDVLVTIDGVEFRDTAELVSYLGEHKAPDEMAVITLIRDGTTLELSVKIGKRP